MYHRKLLAVLATVSLAGGALLGVAGPVFGDDTVVIPDPALTVVADPPVADPPAADPIPDPVIEPTTDPVTEAPQEQAPDPQPAASARVQVQGKPDNDNKVWVCKFVASQNSPGGYRLKEGKQPIEVSVNALDGDVNTGPGASFSDAQPSFVVAADDDTLCAHTVTVVEEQVVCPSGDEDGIVTVTTTTTTYYGTTAVNVEVVHGTRPLTESELADCGHEGPLVATASVSLTAATCFAPQQLVLGMAVNASWGLVTDPAGSDDYSVTATADEGAAFAGDLPSLTFQGQLDASLTGPPCDPTTLGLVLPKVTFTAATCFADGSYTLGAADGYDPALLTWTVNGTAGIPSGTYQVTSPAVVTVTAAAVAQHGLEEGWVDPDPRAFPAVGACELPTLAFTGTGADNGSWLVIAGGFVLLGIVAVLLRRRRS